MKNLPIERDRFKIFDIEIDNLTMKDSLSCLFANIRNPYQVRTKTACFVNTNSLNQAFISPQLKEIINQHHYVFPDGSGVRIAARRFGIEVKENVNGTDMLPLLCNEAIKQEASIFLLGSSEGIAETTAMNLQKSYPGLKIAGYHHGFINDSESIKVIDKINQSNADIVLVGMGTPLQENWLQQYAPRLKTSMAIAVGGLFDFYSGRIPRAPKFFRKTGMEWVWRLMQEPKSKFKRYVIGNPLFLFRLAIN